MVYHSSEYLTSARNDARSNIKDSDNTNIDDNADLEEHLPESLRLAISDDQFPESFRNVIEQLDPESTDNVCRYSLKYLNMLAMISLLLYLNFFSLATNFG